MLVLWELLSYAGIGAVAGFFAGLLGIGGGAIIGPMLIFVYTGLLDFSLEYAAHMAVATASSVIVLTAPVSAAAHARQNNIDWRLAFLISIGAIGGGVAGAHSAAYAPATVLKVWLIIFLFANTISMLLPGQRAAAASSEGAASPHFHLYELLPVSFLIGTVSAVLGIGGGALTIPYLHRRGVFIRKVIGTSAFIGFPLALAASVSYIWTGMREEGLPPGAWGYVYLPALFGIAFFSIAAAYGGAKTSKKLPVDTLRKIFALMTAAIALRLLVSVIEIT